jgi:hypothetical protein
MHIPRHLLVATLLAVALGGSLSAQPPVGVVRQETVVLNIHAIGSFGDGGSPQSPRVIEVDPDKGSTLAFGLPWPDAQSPSELTLSVVERPPVGEARHSIRIDAELRLVDDTLVKATHDLAFSEPSTSLFEVYRTAGKSLTLVIEFDTTEQTVMSKYPEITAPVFFLLEVQRVVEDKVTSLETNRIQSFIGQPVSYAFKLGETDEAAAIRLQLTPVRISGSLLEIEIEISGTIPGEDTIAAAGRGERLIATKDTPTTIAFETGEPANGYRFIVTADF